MSSPHALAERVGGAEASFRHPVMSSAERSVYGKEAFASKESARGQ